MKTMTLPDTLAGLREIDDMELDEAMGDTTETPALVRVDTEEKAQWAADKAELLRRKVNEIMHAAGDRVAILQERIECLQAAATHDAQRYAHRAEFFEGALEGYVRDINAADPKTKSRSFGAVHVALRKQPDTYERDDAALLEIVSAAGLTDCTKTLLAWAETKKHLVPAGDGVVLKDTGDIIPADVCRFVPGVVKGTVTVDL